MTCVEIGRLDKDSWPVAELVDKRNAGVMIAAPDMYVALRELINAVLNGDPCHDAIQRGKAALAKASGEGEV